MKSIQMIAALVFAAALTTVLTGCPAENVEIEPQRDNDESFISLEADSSTARAGVRSATNNASDSIAHDSAEVESERAPRAVAR